MLDDDLCSDDIEDSSDFDSTECDCSMGVNPATGLPMADCGVDVGGNPYGVDLLE